jgi:hypothetical protein
MLSVKGCVAIKLSTWCIGKVFQCMIKLGNLFPIWSLLRMLYVILSVGSCL